MSEFTLGRDNRRFTDCRDEHKNNAAEGRFVCKVDVSRVSFKRLFALLRLRVGVKIGKDFHASPFSSSQHAHKFFSYGVFSFGLIFLVEGRGILQATLTLNGLVGGILLGLFSLGIFFKKANVKVSVEGLESIQIIHFSWRFRELSTAGCWPSFA